MEKSFNNKNFLVIVFEILIIALAIAGITFATQRLLNNRTLTVVKTAEYNLDYVGSDTVTFTNLEPISDNLINYNTKDNVIRVEFSLRGVKENKEEKLIYDVMLNEMNIDCALLNKYTKWNLYKNGRLLTSGNLDPTFDGDVLSDSMRLTEIQETLPKYNSDYDKYVLIFWISESCDDLETCKLVDQSNILDSNLNMKVFIALYTGAKKRYERVPNYDNSCANKPILYNNMIPVTYSNGDWVVADDSNGSKVNLWYDYSDQKWANSVVVTDSSKYKDIGTKIDKKDILANFVWIPRYRYKLWNVTNEVTDTYKAYDEGIDIIFENGLATSNNSKIANDLYITHPAFGNNLRGFWISKYELSKSDNIYKTIGGVEGYRNESFDTYKEIIAKLSKDYNLGENVESHIVSSLEWGATLYLSHSKYGVCSGDGCSSISTNGSYVSGSDKQDTTTRNVYGVYDMAGSAKEFASGSCGVGSATGEVSLSNGNWNNGHGTCGNGEFILRGGKDRGIFTYGELSMDYVDNTSRVSLISK